MLGMMSALEGVQPTKGIHDQRLGSYHILCTSASIIRVLPNIGIDFKETIGETVRQLYINCANRKTNRSARTECATRPCDLGCKSVRMGIRRWLRLSNMKSGRR